MIDYTKRTPAQIDYVKRAPVVAEVDGYEAWSERVQAMGRKVQREADRPRFTTNRLASGARWSS